VDSKPGKGELETIKNEYGAATFSTHLSPHMFAGKDEVLSSITDGSACVVNTLTPEMYRGEEDVFYAGHITGSVNHAIFELMDGGYLLPDDLLSKNFQEKMIGEGDDYLLWRWNRGNVLYSCCVRFAS